MVIAVIVLAAAALFLLWRLTSVKRGIRNVTRELVRTREPGYDRQVRVQLSDRDLEELAAEVNRTIDGQKQLKIDAEAAERRMRQSMSDIAHDIRTPLAVIKGDLQLIGGEELSEKSRGYLAVCLQKSDQLRQMTDDFFELAVLESDSGRVPLSKIDLTSAVMMFLTENEGRIRLAGIEPEVVFPERSVFVMADRQLLGRMLGNLLGNVLKYSGGDLTVKVGSEGGGSVSFENEAGESLPDPSRIFERSYRADSARSGSGAGLGLYIVKLLAEKQGASAHAELSDGRLRVKIEFAEKRQA